MVYLPYSDDVRQPEADTSFIGLAHSQADKSQIEAAERMMAALSLPEFASSNIPNPTLQRHYQVKHKPSSRFGLEDSTSQANGLGKQ